MKIERWNDYRIEQKTREKISSREMKEKNNATDIKVQK